MKRGRPPRGAEHAERVAASAETKSRLKTILQTLSGEKSVEEACRELEVTETHFHRLREKALAGAAAALEPKAAGRPRTEPDRETSEMAALKAQVQELKLDLRAAQIREELAVVMPQVLLPREESGAEKKGGGKAGK